MLPACGRDQAAAQEGATAPPPLEEAVNLHFAALVERDGRCLALASAPASCSTQHAVSVRRGDEKWRDGGEAVAGEK